MGEMDEENDDVYEIEWTQATWNPTRGCTRISPGCQHCYAERFAHRLSGPGKPYEGLTRASPQGPRWAGRLRLVPEILQLPLRWRKPRLVFVNSMSDLFHEAIPLDFVKDVFRVMQEANWHTFQVLTKRPEYALQIADRLSWPENVWLGVSVETKPD
jgi:protein gp37